MYLPLGLEAASTTTQLFIIITNIDPPLLNLVCLRIRAILCFTDNHPVQCSLSQDCFLRPAILTRASADSDYLSLLRRFSFKSLNHVTCSPRKLHWQWRGGPYYGGAPGCEAERELAWLAPSRRLAILFLQPSYDWDPKQSNILRGKILLRAPQVCPLQDQWRRR